MKIVNINKEVINELDDLPMNDQRMINYDEVKDWIGYKKKQSVVDMLKKQNFKENIDYVITEYKPLTGRPGSTICMTIGTIKKLCMLSQSEKGQKLIDHYIEMEKLFKENVSTKVQNQITVPILEMNKIVFDSQIFMNKEVVYLIYITNDLYKFGISKNIEKRLKRHKRELDYQYVVKCWDCSNRTISSAIESNIKVYSRINKIKRIYKGQTEIIKTNNIDGLIKVFNDCVNDGLNGYKEIIGNREMELKNELLTKTIEIMNKCEMSEKNGMDLNKVIDELGIKDLLISIMKGNMDNKDVKIININSGNKDIKIMNVDPDNIEINEVEIIKETIDDLPDYKVTMTDLINCSDCKEDKPKSEYDVNPKKGKGILYKNCKGCLTTRRNKYDKGRHLNVKTEEERLAKLQKNREYYNKNAAEVIKQKKEYAQKRMETQTDPNKTYCKGCNSIKNNTEFGLNPKTKTPYKQCDLCREKDRKKK